MPYKVREWDHSTLSAYIVSWFEQIIYILIYHVFIRNGLADYQPAFIFPDFIICCYFLTAVAALEVILTGISMTVISVDSSSALL